MQLFKNLLVKFKSELSLMEDNVSKESVFDLIDKVFTCEGCDVTCLVDEKNIFLAMLDTIPVPVYYKNTDGVYLACNKALCELYGFPREEIIGKTSYDFFPKETADNFTAGDRILIKERTQERVEHRGEFSGLSDGFHIIHKTAFIRNGEVEGVIGVITDMTEQKMIEDRAWASEAFFKSLFELSPMPIVLINNFDYIVDLNTTADTFFYSSETLAGQDASNLFCSYSDFERALKSENATQKVMIYNNTGIKQEVIAMRSSCELNGEMHHAIAFVRLDI